MQKFLIALAVVGATVFATGCNCNKCKPAPKFTSTAPCGDCGVCSDCDASFIPLPGEVK